MSSRSLAASLLGTAGEAVNISETIRRILGEITGIN
jgi:hypothetical protein